MGVQELEQAPHVHEHAVHLSRVGFVLVRVVAIMHICMPILRGVVGERSITISVGRLMPTLRRRILRYRTERSAPVRGDRAIMPR